MRKFLICATRVDYLGRIIGYGNVLKELDLQAINLENLNNSIAKDLGWEITEVYISSMCDVTPIKE